MTEQHKDATWVYDEKGFGTLVSTKEYHTDYASGDSHSSLELFRESPAKYAAIRVFRTMQADAPSAAMKVGQAIHALVLEYDRECQFVKKETRKKPDCSALWFGPISKMTAKIELSDKEIQLVYGMLMALVSEPDAWELLVMQPGMNEHVFGDFDELTLVHRKCKPDRVLYNGLVVDLKTVDGPVDPSSWSRCLSKWGYHRQAAFYLDVLQGAGQKADMFVFLAVSKDPPHEIGIYPIDRESIDLGREENRVDLEWLAECRRTGVWKHEWQGKILTVGVPRWKRER